MPVLEQINLTTYKIVSGRDTIELGDINALECLGHLRYRRPNSASEFTLAYPGSPTGLIMLDMANGIVKIPYGDATIELTAHAPDSEHPDGRSEFNVILKSKPTPDANGDYWQVLNFNSTGLTFDRVLGLDEEWSQERCHEEWYLDLYDDHEGNDLYGHDNGTGIFVRTSTEIRTPDGAVVLKSKPEHLVHSLLGTAIKNTHKKHELGEIKVNTPNKGKQLTYTNISRDHARLPRREVIDAKGKKARIEDIQLIGNQLKFKLPKEFIEKAKYPVQHATGVDPAYTEDMDFWVTDTFGDSDSTWSDYDLNAEKGVPLGAVAEIIFAMQEAGVENSMGVRTDGGSLNRFTSLHEAEGGGVQTCRMFVLCDADTGLIECYHSDVSDDDSYYLVGYWENVGFTERFDDETPGTGGSWQADEVLVDSGAASLICHFLLRNQENGVSNTMGVRDTSSVVERKILVHEQENGGESILDMLTKADASYQVDLYTSDIVNTVITNAGYFGVEMDFVEDFYNFPITVGSSWRVIDLTGYLDQDGRVCDFLLIHNKTNTPATLGVRGGDDTTTLRYISEHEAEDDGGATGELTGFGISAASNASGEIKAFCNQVANDVFYFTGYFKPAAAGPQELTAAAVAETSSVVQASIAGTGDAPLTGTTVQVVSSIQAAAIAGTGTAPLTGTIVSVTSSVVQSSVENVSAEQELTAAVVAVTSSVSNASISGSGDAPLTGTVVGVTSSIQGSVIAGSGNAPLTAAVVSATSSVQGSTLSGSGNAPLTAAVIGVVSSVVNAVLAPSGAAPLTGAVVSVTSSVSQASISGTGTAPLTTVVVSATSAVSQASIAGIGTAPLTGTTINVVSSVVQAGIAGSGAAPLAGAVVNVLASVVAASIAGSGSASLTGAAIAVSSTVNRAVIAGAGVANLTAGYVNVVSSVVSGQAELLWLALFASPLAVVTSVAGTNVTLSWILVCEGLGIDPSSLGATKVPISRLETTRVTSSRQPLCRPKRRYT